MAERQILGRHLHESPTVMSAAALITADAQEQRAITGSQCLRYHCWWGRLARSKPAAKFTCGYCVFLALRSAYGFCMLLATKVSVQLLRFFRRLRSACDHCVLLGAEISVRVSSKSAATWRTQQWALCCPTCGGHLSCGLRPASHRWCTRPVKAGRR